MPPPVIHGERTLVRPVTHDDLDLLAGWLAQPPNYEWWGGRPIAREEVKRDLLGGRRPEVEPFIVEADGAPIGYLQWWTDDPRSGGIDMFLIPSARARGLGPDAARAVARHLADVAGWRRITVDPVISNARAIRAWTKAGFQAEGECTDPAGDRCLLMVFESSA